MSKIVHYIVINYSDSDYTIDFMNIANEYCNLCNKSLLYWKEAGNLDSYNKAKNTFLMDINYINNIFINKLIGNIIINTKFSNIINASEFQNITEISKSLMSNIKFLSNEEFESIKNDLGYSEYLVIYFENEIFNYKIY